MRPPGPKDRPPPLETTPEEVARLVVIGNFDGVHRGHQWVLSRAAELAKQRGLKLCVLTFDPHPAVVLERSSRRPLTTTTRKIELLHASVSGLEVVVQPFDGALAALSPAEFAELYLKRKLNARSVLVGENFRYGSKRAGDLLILQKLGLEYGFDAWAENLKGDQAGAFSSTRVRKLLGEGRVKEAGEILSRPHQIFGTVIHGDKRGRTLGFPTANLGGMVELLPQEGVYAVQAFDVTSQGSSFLSGGVAHIGARPTVSEESTVEVHLLGFSGDLYGRSLRIDLLSHLRSVQKFESLLALKTQIAVDVEAARLCLAAVSGVSSDVSAEDMDGT